MASVCKLDFRQMPHRFRYILRSYSLTKKNGAGAAVTELVRHDPGHSRDPQKNAIYF